MAIKSLISQLRQIKSSESYSDTESMAGAEGATFLEDDLNFLRTQLKNVTGATNWYDLPTETLQTISDSGVVNKKIVQPIQVNNVTFASGLVSLSGITSGTAALVGSTSTDGYVYDDAVTPSVDSKAMVMVRDAVTNAVLVDANERTIYGILKFNGTDGGTVDGSTNVLSVQLYTDVSGTSTATTYSGTAEIVIPQRIALGVANESFSMVNAGFAGAVGAIELGAREWTELNTGTGAYEVSDGTNDELGITQNTDLTSAINAIIPEASKARDIAAAVQTVTGVTVNSGTDWSLATDLATLWDGAGVTTTYLAGGTQTNFIDAFIKLDQEIASVQGLAAGASADKFATIVSAGVAEATLITLPNAKTYLSTDKDAMDVLINGQELISDTLAGGAGLGDYAESSNTQITFNFDLVVGDIVTYKIYKTGN